MPGYTRVFRLFFSILTATVFLSCTLAQESDRFIVYGDSRTNNDANTSVHEAIVARFMAETPGAVFNVGDLVYDGAVEQLWAEFDRVVAPVGVPFYSSPGNHDKESPSFYARFPSTGDNPWHTVRVGRYAFVMVDTCLPSGLGSAQYTWLDGELASLSQDLMVKALFVVTHYPFITNGSSSHPNPSAELNAIPGQIGNPIADLTALFEYYSVDVVFSGHSHYYERSEKNGVVYIITGGGGSPLHDLATIKLDGAFAKAYHYCVVDGDTVTARDINGINIDTIKLQGRD